MKRFIYLLFLIFGIGLNFTEIQAQCTPPSTPPSNFISFAAGSTSIYLNWTPGSGDYSLVIAKEGSPVDANPVNGTLYLAHESFGSGPEIGDGNYVMFNIQYGSAYAIGLKPKTTYYFAVFTYNIADLCYNFNKATAFSTTEGGYPEFQNEDGTTYQSINMDFGITGLNTYKDTTIYIKNIEKGTLVIGNIMIYESNHFQLVSVPSLPIILPEQERIPITIRFKPVSLGDKIDDLVVYFGNWESSIGLHLKGTGAIIPHHYRSVKDGLWEDPYTWEVSTDNLNWVEAGSAPSDIDYDVTINHYITVYQPVAIKNAVITGNGFLEVYKGPLTIINGQGDDMTVYGILKTSFDGSVTTSGNIAFKKDSYYIHNVNHKGGIPNSTWETGSTCEITGYTSTPDINKAGWNQHFYNLIWNCPAQTKETNLAGNLISIKGNFIVENTGKSQLKLADKTSNLTIDGNMTIASNATLDMGGTSQPAKILTRGDLYIAGKIISTNPAGGEITFNGQTQTFYTYDSNALGKNIDIVLDNKSTVTLESDITINRNLTLKSGKMTLDAYDMNVSGTITGGSKDAYIQTNGLGRLLMAVKGTTTFPIGNAAYNPVNLTTQTQNILGARVVDAVYTEGLSGKIITQDVVKRTWDITGNLRDTLAIELFWSASDEGLRFDRDNCYVSHFEGLKWNGEAPNAASNGTMYSRTRGGFTSLSPFAIGSNGVLPVTYNLFSARPYKNNVKINFSTLTEVDNEYFEIQRSVDGIDFEELGTLDGGGDSNQELRYIFYDTKPIDGNNYYRIRQVSYDGYETFTDTRKVNMSNANITVTLRNRDGFIDVNTDAADYNVTIYNMAGQEVGYFPHLFGGQSVQLDHVQPGLYFAKIEIPQSDYYDVVKILKY